MPRALLNDRALALSCALLFAIFFVVGALGLAQIVSLHQWCGRDAPDRSQAELRIGSVPAVVCRSDSATLELPISPAVVTVIAAVIGAAVSLMTLLTTARRVRDARNR
jgi:hypothetical protein